LRVSKVLLVKDDEVALIALTDVLEQSGFAVTCATNAPEALKRIGSELYDALLTDFHISSAREGLMLVNALRHANPSAVIFLLSAFPQLGTAGQAILLRAAEILARPTEQVSFIDAFTDRIAIGSVRNHEIESVGTILGRTTEAAIAEWYSLVQKESLLMSVPMSCEHRCGHLAQLFYDLVFRLDSATPTYSEESLSAHATLHGINRRKLGYTAPMMVEEARILEVSIFHTLHNNRANLDFGQLLIGVATIADEVDSQLRQAMESFHTDSGGGQRIPSTTVN
jgi:ActR/RegA family two-component response regulator